MCLTVYGVILLLFHVSRNFAHLISHLAPAVHLFMSGPSAGAQLQNQDPHLCHKATAGLALGGASGLITFGSFLNISLRASCAQHSSIKHNKRPFCDIVSGFLCLRKCKFSWLSQLEKVYIFCDSHGAPTDLLEKVLIFPDLYNFWKLLIFRDTHGTPPDLFKKRSHFLWLRI